MTEQEKIALSETQRAFITPIVGGIAAGGVAYGLPAALDKIREVRVQRNRDSYITAMKDVHPDLKGIPKKDLHVAYNSLAMHSPHVLRDPLLGGQELLRMSRYRQADINSLNEMNKLRGNSMMDQAFMNATNMVSSGIAEGFKGYQAQRIADQDQAYRVKMDQHRMNMDNEKLKLENDKFKYTQDRDMNRDAYQKDRDATLDARDRNRDALSKAQFDQSVKRDAQSASQFEAQMKYRRQRDIVSDAQYGQTRQDRLNEAKTRNRQYAQTRQDQNRQYAQTRKDNAAARNDRNRQFNLKHKANEVSLNLAYHKDQREREKHKAWTDEGAPGPIDTAIQIKKASANDIYDIVARLRDRNP